MPRLIVNECQSLPGESFGEPDGPAGARSLPARRPWRNAAPRAPRAPHRSRSPPASSSLMSPALNRLRDRSAMRRDNCRIVDRQCSTVPCPQQTDIRHPDVRHHVQTAAQQGVRRPLRRQSAPPRLVRSLPQRVDRPSRRRFELLRAPGKQQRQNGITQQAGLDEICARNAQVGEAFLKAGVVPQGDCDRLAFSQSVVD